MTIGFLSLAHERRGRTGVARDAGRHGARVELVPRISRAQSMDALSSQALVSGYRCAIVAAGLLRRFFPLNMTAAGTVQPAEVVVLGAGVAGLQAIATSKRLGAVVKAYDVRPAAPRRSGRWARSRRPRARDARGLRRLRPRDDRGPGRPAARAARAVHRRRRRADHHRRRARAGRRRCWSPRAMVEQMRPGSVVVDLAAESGGNVEGVGRRRGGRRSAARRLGRPRRAVADAGDASRLYAQNVVNLLAADDARTGVVAAGLRRTRSSPACCVTHDGEVARGRWRREPEEAWRSG